MDTLEFRLSAFNYTAYRNACAVAYIFVNGKDLLDTLYEYEKREDLKVIAHAPLTLDELHENLSEGYESNAVPIFSCEGSATVFVTVEVGADKVVWKTSVLPPLVFDKAQYFREIYKLKQWRFNDALVIEYDGIDCGFVGLNLIKSGKVFHFGFDELLSDPFPQLVNLFLHVQRGEDCTENLGDTYDDRITALKISTRHEGDKVFLTAELVDKKIILTETYEREDLAAMLKKIFDALLNDKYFPYSYPCFWYLGESDESDTVLDAIEAAHPYWTNGDVCNCAVESGQLKLAPRYEKYLGHYKKMLTDYVIPDKWFE